MCRREPRASRGIPMLLGVVLSGLLTGCGGGEDGPPAAQPVAEDGPVDVRQVQFAPELNVRLEAMTRTDEGIYYQDVREGRGATAEAGRAVSVEYRGWLPDGTLFEERPSADGFGLSEFVLGENAPVDGLNHGMQGMRTGGVRRIVIPPEHGYGLVGRPAGVPLDSPLVFEVRLLAVRDAPPPPAEER
jgi:FKBP-type peptidyl-prolyl cis-trans isomerase FkpA